MDTSKNYYESFMRDYQTYGRGRTLEQYCRDEGADFKWMEKAREQYGVPTFKKEKGSKRTKKSQDKPVDMIQLHFDSEENPTVNDQTENSAADTSEPRKSEKKEWKITTLIILTPQGHEIEVRTSNWAAVSELLTKLTV